MARRAKSWSYNAGEKGKNWVRVYERRPGQFMAEWFEEALNETGRPLIDPETGRPKKVRRRTTLPKVTDTRGARAKANELAERFAELDSVHAPGAPLTLHRLLTLYLQEVTPHKSQKTQEHDRQAARMFLAYFGADTVLETAGLDGAARSGIGRKMYSAFIRDRRAGNIPGFAPVKDRAIAYDIEFLNAVFNWATREEEDRPALLQRNPWKGFPKPRERNPSRPALTPRIVQLLLEHSPDWRFSVALVLVRETGRRLSAVRRLRWSDVNLETRTIRWVPEHDKTRRGRVTPISDEAAAALRTAPRGLGNAPVFPAPLTPAEPASRYTLVQWFKRTKRRVLKRIEAELDGKRRELETAPAAARAGIEAEIAALVQDQQALRARGLGFHSGKRAKVRDPKFRALPTAIQEALVDTNHETLRRIYDDVSVDDMREAMERAERRSA